MIGIGLPAAIFALVEGECRENHVSVRALNPPQR